MKQIAIGFAGILLLTACGEAADVKLAASCSAVMADPDVQRDLIEASVSVEAYCACTSAMLLSLPEAASEKSVAAMTTMESLMAEHDGSAEAAFEVLSKRGRAEDATPEEIAAHKNVDDLGEQLEDILDEMRTEGGTCPV